jgi:hypothetical protein
MYTSVFPAYSALNAIHFPSGEKCGLDVCPWKLVTRRAMPPARSTIQMLLAYANAIWVALTVGVRSKRVGAPLGAAASTINRRSASKARRRESNRKAGLNIGLSSGKVWQHLYHKQASEPSVLGLIIRT